MSQVMQQAEILHAVGRLLREATMLRVMDRNEETEEVMAKVAEIKAFIHPDDIQTGLQVRWCDDPGFECYVLVAD